MAIYKGSNFIGLNNIKEKKVYVEVPEGSTIDDMSENNTVAISPQDYQDLQDAVNYKTGTLDEKNLQQMIDALKRKHMTDINLQLRITENTPMVTHGVNN